MAAARSNLYEMVATATIDTDGRTAAEIAQDVIGLLAGNPADI